jgi:hypothetical protein
MKELQLVEIKELNDHFKKFILKRCKIDQYAANYHFPNFINFICEKPCRFYTTEEKEDHYYLKNLLKKVITSKDHFLKLKKLEIVLKIKK